MYVRGNPHAAQRATAVGWAWPGAASPLAAVVLRVHPASTSACQYATWAAEQAFRVFFLPQHLPLPQGVIRVLHRQQHPPLAPHPPASRRKPHDGSSGQRPRRPPVPADVVQHHHQHHGPTRATRKQPCPQRHVHGAQVEQVEAASPPRSRAARLNLGDLGDRQRSHANPCGVQNLSWHGWPSAAGNTVRSALMPPGHIGQRLPPERRCPGHPAQPQHQREVVRRRRSFWLSHEPQPLLGVRQRHPACALAAAGQRRPGRSRRTDQQGGQSGRGPRLEHHPDRRLRAEHGAHADISRMASMLNGRPDPEEVILRGPPGPGPAPARTPRTRSLPAPWRGSRRAPGAAAKRGAGSAARSIFPFARSPAARRVPPPRRAAYGPAAAAANSRTTLAQPLAGPGAVAHAATAPCGGGIR